MQSSNDQKKFGNRDQALLSAGFIGVPPEDVFQSGEALVTLDSCPAKYTKIAIGIITTQDCKNLRPVTGIKIRATTCLQREILPTATFGQEIVSTVLGLCQELWCKQAEPQQQLTESTLLRPRCNVVD